MVARVYDTPAAMRENLPNFEMLQEVFAHNLQLVPIVQQLFGQKYTAQ